MKQFWLILEFALFSATILQAGQVAGIDINIPLSVSFRPDMLSSLGEKLAALKLAISKANSGNVKPIISYDNEPSQNRYTPPQRASSFSSNVSPYVSNTDNSAKDNIFANGILNALMPKNPEVSSETPYLPTPWAIPIIKTPDKPNSASDKPSTVNQLNSSAGNVNKQSPTNRAGTESQPTPEPKSIPSPKGLTRDESDDDSEEEEEEDDDIEEYVEPKSSTASKTSNSESNDFGDFGSSITLMEESDGVPNETE